MKTFDIPLSSEEEKKYLHKLMEGDKEARRILIEKNMRLVAYIAKKYSMINMDMDDVMSIGSIGLIKAIDSFSPNKNIRLATYASKCIENELLMLIRSEKKISREIYFNEFIKVDNAGNAISLIDIIESNDEDVATRLDLLADIKRMYECIESELTKREKMIIYMRYGIKGHKEYTQKEIANKLNISRSYVSRIEKKALLKLKVKIG